MQPEPTEAPPAIMASTDPRTPTPRGRGLLRSLAVAALVGCSVLGVLLYRAHEREQALRAELTMCEYQLNLEQAARRRVEAEREEVQESLEAARGALRTATSELEVLRSALRQAEFARDSANRSLASVRAEFAECEDSLASVRAEFSECEDSLESTVRIARSHRDKLDEITSAIRIGMIGVADIPAKGFVFTGGYDLESEYRKVVDEYNDLVGRFNAAIERSDDLGEILNRVINILRS